MVWGCSSDECLQNKTALPYAGFYSSSTTPAALSVDSLQVTGYQSPGDSVLFAGKTPIRDLYLPFRIDHDTTTYIFRYLHKEFVAIGGADTIRFIYTRNPRFVSSACGVSYVFEIKDIQTTRFLIDSVVCPMHMIDNMDTENLKIYFRVSEDE